MVWQEQLKWWKKITKIFSPELLRMYYSEYQPRVWLFEGKPGSDYWGRKINN
jgi:hypothetical protein